MATLDFQFNVSDDAAFSQLVDAHALRASNVLSAVKPSALNFTANCWTSADLQHVAYNGSELTAVDRITYLANALGPALPSQVDSAGLLDSNEYWDALVQLPSTSTVLAGTIQQCNRTRSFTIPPMNFAANCSATADFWWHNVFNLTIPSSFALDPSWLPLFKASLPPPYSNMSDTMIAILCESARIPSLKYINDFPLPLQDQLENAAAGCALSACQNLGYSGNADIAGKGAVIAYGFIAAVSTLLAATSIYFKLRPTKKPNSFRRTINTSAVVFWDTIIWFGLLATVAGWLYLKGQADSLYEYAISFLVLDILLNASTMLCTLYLAEVDTVKWSFASISRILPQIASYTMAVSLNWSQINYDPQHDIFGRTFIDLPCYAAGLWPLTYLLAAARFEAALLILIILCTAGVPLIMWFLGSRMTPKRYRVKNRMDKLNALGPYWIYLIAFVATIAIWMDFAFIVQIRSRARAAFGSSYQDDALGYGQVISAGLAAQAIYSYICAVMGYLNGESEEENEAAESKGLILGT